MSQKTKWWENSLSLSLTELLPLLKQYEFGDVYYTRTGKREGFPKRAPRIGIFGAPHSGKSGLINNLAMIWRGTLTQYQEECKLSSPEITGVHAFQPITLFDKEEGNFEEKKEVMLLFDTAGVYPDDHKSPLYEVIEEIVLGRIKPGHVMTGETQYRIQSEDIKDWSGVDGVILVAKYDNEKDIKAQIKIYSKLTVRGLYPVLVITNSGKNTSHPIFADNYRSIPVVCVENYDKGTDGRISRDEEQERRLLQVMVKLVEEMERKPRGTSNITWSYLITEYCRKIAKHVPAIPLQLVVIIVLSLISLSLLIAIITTRN